MLATVASATLVGVDGVPVTIEAHVGQGLPGFTVVGLPDASCREARDRTRAAILSSGFTWPQQRATVNLGIAIAVLVASEQLSPDVVHGRAFVGELGLDGSLRHVPGTLSLVDALEVGEVVVPMASAAEAEVVNRLRVRCAPDLRRLVDALTAEAPWPVAPDPHPVPPGPAPVDMAEVRGHPLARRAVEVAAAGGHHLLMTGPPGAGKTMLAERLPGILPELDDRSALEVTRVHSAAGLPFGGGLVRRPPMRAPHHGASAVAIIGGGGAHLRPGEISLAHGGVLFLDELGEFPLAVLDQLRQPLEGAWCASRGPITAPRCPRACCSSPP
jgi:magnesium chelatase family protein